MPHFSARIAISVCSLAIWAKLPDGPDGMVTLEQDAPGDGVPPPVDSFASSSEMDAK